MSAAGERAKGPLILRTFGIQTTGQTNPGPDDLVEIAWCDSIWNKNHFLIMPPTSLLVCPGRPVAPEGLARHHIDDEELRHAMGRDDAVAYISALPKAISFSSHDVDAFLTVVPELADQKWVSTYKCGVALLPEAGEFSAQYLRYHMALPVDRSLAGAPHRSSSEAYVVAHILVKMLQDREIRQLLRISAAPLQGAGVESLPDISRSAGALEHISAAAILLDHSMSGGHVDSVSLDGHAGLPRPVADAVGSLAAGPEPVNPPLKPLEAAENPNWQTELAEAVLKSPVSYAVLFG